MKSGAVKWYLLTMAHLNSDHLITYGMIRTEKSLLVFVYNVVEAGKFESRKWH